jgi:hypothetical protein
MGLLRASLWLTGPGVLLLSLVIRCWRTQRYRLRHVPVAAKLRVNTNCKFATEARPSKAGPIIQHGSRISKMNKTGQHVPERFNPPMTDMLSEPEAINFGELPETINALLQQGVAAYRHDRSRADRLFRQALALAPTQLPIYFCLYKIHTYQGNLDEAQAAAENGLGEAARQAGWALDWREWRPQAMLPDGASRFALYTLKALAFIHLRQNNPHQANQILDRLRRLDPAGAVGWPVVAALAEGSVEAPR